MSVLRSLFAKFVMMWGWWWWWWWKVIHWSQSVCWLTEWEWWWYWWACFAFDINDRSLHGFATEDHSMWKFHSSFCHGCEIPYRSSCHGSCFHGRWTQRCSLTRCHCSGISLSLSSAPYIHWSAPKFTLFWINNIIYYTSTLPKGPKICYFIAVQIKNVIQ